MRITRIYADEQGDSRFADIEVPTARIHLLAELPAFRLNRFTPPTRPHAWTLTD